MVLTFVGAASSTELSRLNDDIRFHMADDDPDDRLLVKEALLEAGVASPLDFTVDGQDLMDYLRGEGEYSNQPDRPMPDVILLDLNMPRKDGRECIQEIRADKQLRHIPIVVLTTSSADEDVFRSYQLGVNSFIQKPVGFDDLVRVVTKLTDYWVRFVRLPGREAADAYR